ncbi:hypothetical protein [Rhodococcus jostii]|uniref:hypothetical protein n=1 Tax=Rhodococcus jostii TaxID=132919 RepID=UPI003638F3A7
MAILLEVDRARRTRADVGDLAARWDNRVTMRILGPMDPYDFVVRPKPEGCEKVCGVKDSKTLCLSVRSMPCCVRDGRVGPAEDRVRPRIRLG